VSNLDDKEFHKHVKLNSGFRTKTLQ